MCTLIEPVRDVLAITAMAVMFFTPVLLMLGVMWHDNKENRR